MRHDASAGISETSHRAVITRADGTVVDLGIVSFWHRNPVRRAWWRVWGKPRAEARIRRHNRTREA